MTKERLLKKEIWIGRGNMKWQPYNRSKKYLQAVLARYSRPQIKDFQGNFYWRMSFGFKAFAISFEYWEGENIPELEDVKGLRVVMWDKPKIDLQESDLKKIDSWLQARGVFAASAPTQAYFDLQDENIKQIYFKNWNETTRRYRNRWNKQVELGSVFIKKVSKDEYLEEYKYGVLPKIQKQFFINKTENFAKIYGKDLEFLLAYDLSGNCLGGLSYVYDFLTSQSVHFTAFVTKLGDVTPAGVGLIDFWVRECIDRKIPFATLGIVWSKGQPNSWKGYSDFKLHFKPKIFSYKNVYVKFIFKI